VNSGFSLLYWCNHQQKPFTCFQTFSSSQLWIDEWFPDGLSECSIALSLIGYRLVVSNCFIVKVFRLSSTKYSILLKADYFQPIFVLTVITIMWSERNS